MHRTKNPAVWLLTELEVPMGEKKRESNSRRLHGTRKYDALSTSVVSFFVIAPQIYLAQNPQVNLNFWFLFIAVILPTMIAAALFLLRGRRILFFAYLALIWAVTEDAPVYLDSLFTWPEVTSGFQHSLLEILFHCLTIVFVSLVVREATKSKEGKLSVEVLILAVLAVVTSYAQNIPLDFVKVIVSTSWYALDIFEHIASVIFLYLAVRVARA